MRDHSHHIELSREEAVSRMLALVAFHPEGLAADSELVPVEQAFGRTLATDVLSQVDMPNCRNCALDSIAVRWDDFEAAAALGGPGALPDTAAWVRGVNWEFANTGVALPDGFDTAIVIEHVEVSPDEQSVKIDAAPSARYAGTREPGSRLRRGDLLAAAGTLVTPDVAARIAGGNVCSVRVVRKPRVAFIPTGNELVRGGGQVARGKNIETNSLLVRGKVAAWGGECQVFDIVPDVPELIEAAVLEACRTCDIVVLNAGSSKGSDDWSVEQLENLGQVVCHQTNHGPGHHSSYALVEGTPVVGISGPPGGATFTLNFYLRPVMRAFLGQDPAPERFPVRLLAPFPKGSLTKMQLTPGAKLPGESRPAEATEPGQQFYSIKFLMVEPQSDGTLGGRPLPGRPGSPEAEAANAFFMMPAAVDAVPPAVGDVIWVELR